MNELFEQLTLEEVELIENLLDAGIDDVFGDGRPRGKALKVLVWVLRKRENPNLKIDEVKGITLADAMKSMGFDTKKD